MRRAALFGAGAALALAAVAAGAAEGTGRRPGGTAGRRPGTPAGTPFGGTAGAPVDGPPMPEVRGLGLWRVFTRLDRRARLDVHDASGRDRRVVWPGRWRVCTQYPAPGTGLGRRTTVVIGVLRKGEPCPPRVTTARR